MEPTESVPDVEPDRAVDLAREAVAARPLSQAAEASLTKAVSRLPDAIARSDDEARVASR